MLTKKAGCFTSESWTFVSHAESFTPAYSRSASAPSDCLGQIINCYWKVSVHQVSTCETCAVQLSKIEVQSGTHKRGHARACHEDCSSIPPVHLRSHMAQLACLCFKLIGSMFSSKAHHLAVEVAGYERSSAEHKWGNEEGILSRQHLKFEERPRDGTRCLL